MRQLPPCGVLLLALLFSGNSLAQSELTFSSLNVDLWPEYDQTTVLVMYRIELVPLAALPAPVKVRIPAGAGSPNAVAELLPDGRLVSLPYQRRRDGDWAWIELTAHEPQIQIEYYDPGLQREGSTRSFEFTWPGDYAVGNLVVSVQQPVGTSDLQTAPDATRSGPGPRGLIYHSVELGRAGAGESAAVTLTYQKETDALSTDSLPPTPDPGPPPESEVATSKGSNKGWAWIVAGVGAVLLGGLVVWRLGRARAPLSPSRPASTQHPAAAADRDHVAFCPQCGAPAGKEDRFCHGCGSRLPTG